MKDKGSHFQKYRRPSFSNPVFNLPRPTYVTLNRSKSIDGIKLFTNETEGQQIFKI